MNRNYGRAGSYALYHYKGSCTTAAHTRCPEEAVKVSPNHGGDTITATLQAFTGGKWRFVTNISGPLAANSTAIVITWYTGPGVIGVNLRAHVQIKGDAENLGRTSSWQYFRVTK